MIYQDIIYSVSLKNIAEFLIPFGVSGNKIHFLISMNYLQMTRVGLTEEEERQILLLLEGDVSDLEGINENSSDEEDINLADEVENSMPSRSIETYIADCLQNENQIEIETDNMWDYESEDEISLAELQVRLAQKKTIRHSEKGKQKSKKLYWNKKDIDQVETICHANEMFSKPAEISTPLQYFKKFFDDDIINNLVEQTNMYSIQKGRICINTNYNEISVFLGIHIMSGIIRMPSYKMYWARETRYPPIADLMSRNRFETLKSNFHINDNTQCKARDHPEYDKLFKVRPLIDKLRENFLKTEPEEHHSVDEIMIPFKGHSSLKQYVKNKPHKWGIKVFARAGVSGIIYDFEVYVGKGTTEKSTELGISGDIVMRLSQYIPRNKNFKLYTDNFFTSYHLFARLKEQGIWSTGTVRLNRLKGINLLEDNILKKKRRGSYDFSTESQENITAVKWFDNKSVSLISTFIGVHPMDTVKRWSQSEKKFVNIDRPQIVKNYNLNMGGVDLNDMLVALYRTKIGVKRYYLRIVFHLLDICIVNAWLLYRRDCGLHNIGKYKRLIVFRSEIGHALLHCNSLPQRKKGRPSSSRENTPENRATVKRPVVPRPIDDIILDKKDHWPIHIEPKMRCRFCQAYSRVSCEKCKVALCLTKDRNCFKLFHRA